MAEVHRLAEEEKEKRRPAAGADLAVPWIRRLLLIGIGLGIFQQFTGINSIMYYGTQLLEDAGFSANAAIIANTAQRAVQRPRASPSASSLINKVNRRTMLLVGFLLTHQLPPPGRPVRGADPGRLADQALRHPCSSWSASCSPCRARIGPLVWLMLAEIFPLKIRSFAMGVCVFVLWMANAAVAFAFPPVVAALGIAPTFFIFAALGVASLIFIKTSVPETRGKTLEEFEEEFSAAYSAPGQKLEREAV